MKRLSFLALLLLAAPAFASRVPAEETPVQSDLAIGNANVQMHNREAQQVLNSILADDTFWKGATVSTYKNQLYDEIRLKPTDSGYVPMITGQGDEDFPLEVVADIVYHRNVDLPRVMSGAEAMVRLGSGYDPTVGASYYDCFYLLDFTLFYGHFTQRMYKKYDAANNRYVMWFEKVNESFVGADTWATYQSKIKGIMDNHDRRWLFSGYEEVTDVFGMFVVTPGETKEARVTFVTKITFGEGSGFIAQAGSKMPMVIRAGLRAGFDGCVALAKDEKQKRIAKAP